MSKNVKKIDILNKLRSSGLRPTKQRVEIAKYLFEREKTFHFTVESLNKLLEKKTTSKFALATIYNTVHAFKDAGHLSEVEVRGKKTYFDTNVSDHHHFYDSENSELIDIDANEIVIQKIPKAPNGKKIKNVEVFINLKN
jgi:Fur family iron response transcriptional regulator